MTRAFFKDVLQSALAVGDSLFDQCKDAAG